MKGDWSFCFVGRYLVQQVDRQINREREIQLDIDIYRQIDRQIDRQKVQTDKGRVNVSLNVLSFYNFKFVVVTAVFLFLWWPESVQDGKISYIIIYGIMCIVNSFSKHKSVVFMVHG